MRESEKCNGFLICDDLIEDIDSVIDREKLERLFPKNREAKVLSRTFGKFNINDMPDTLRKKIGIDLEDS